MKVLPSLLLAVLYIAAATLTVGLTPTAVGGTATCASSLGPGIPAPAAITTGIPGYHSAWYGQSGYARLCAGQEATFTIAFLVGTTFSNNTFTNCSGKIPAP